MRRPQRFIGGSAPEQGRAATQAFGLPVSQRLVFAGEVVVEGAHGDPGQVGDFLARDVVQPAFEGELSAASLSARLVSAFLRSRRPGS